ncbi:unnamed protein product [Symbiodinium sp. CCMP2592]|nr:unnamed protein product [Symbiodinium sp. CCMP2592]
MQRLRRTWPSAAENSSFFFTDWPHGLRNLVSILPAYSPSSQDKDALAGNCRGDSPTSDEAVPSLAVPLLAGAEEPLPAEDAFRALEGFPGEPVCGVDGQGGPLEIGPDPEVVRQALSDLAETRERIRQLREASAQHSEAREAAGSE